MLLDQLQTIFSKRSSRNESKHKDSMIHLKSPDHLDQYIFELIDINAKNAQDIPRYAQDMPEICLRYG